MAKRATVKRIEERTKENTKHMEKLGATNEEMVAYNERLKNHMIKAEQKQARANKVNPNQVKRAKKLAKSNAELIESIIEHQRALDEQYEMGNNQ